MRKFFKSTFIILLYLLHITSVYASTNISKTKIIETLPSNLPQDLSFFDMENKKHFLEEYEGQAVLLVFWATWCAPCVSEMEDLDRLQKDFRKLSFKILPISEDYLGVDHIEKFYQDYNIRYLPILHDYKNNMFKALSLVGTPTSILLDIDGKKVLSFSGSVNWNDDKMRELLLKYIPGNPPVPINSYNGTNVNFITNYDTPEHKQNSDNENESQINVKEIENNHDNVTESIINIDNENKVNKNVKNK